VFVQRGDPKCRGPDAVAAAQRPGGAAVRNNVRLPRHRHHTHTGHRVRAKGTPKGNVTQYNTLQNHIILSTDNAILAILQLALQTTIKIISMLRRRYKAKCPNQPKQEKVRK